MVAVRVAGRVGQIAVLNILDQTLSGKSLDDSSKVEAQQVGSDAHDRSAGAARHLDAAGRSTLDAAGNTARPGGLKGPEEFDARWPSWKDDDVEPITHSAPVQLSSADYVALKQAAIRGLFVAVCIQCVVTFVVAMVAFAVSGSAAGVSALAGAAAYAIPNAVFAFCLIRSVNRPGGANPMTFFFGEFFKIAGAGLLIVIAAGLGKGFLVWPAFLIGLLCALKSQWLALVFGRKQPRVVWQPTPAEGQGKQ